MLPNLISLKLDLNGLAGTAWDRFLKIFGQDADSQELKHWIEERTRVGFLQSRDVQCVGMHTPVLLSAIYQPTWLLRERPDIITDKATGKQWEGFEHRPIAVDEFLLRRTNSIITAGPGWGKTTFLRAVFIKFLIRENAGDSESVLPILFTLRDSDSVTQLQWLVSKLSGPLKLKARTPKPRVLLLIDGYDEISVESRKLVSSALLRFAAKNIGEYYLTCRDYYEILDLNATRIRIGEFQLDDQVSFVKAFLLASGAPANAEEIVKDLHDRGFSDLLRHPLLLTLACIVRSSAYDLNSRNVISLIESAIQTLSMRWDQSKGLRREPTTPLDSNTRVKCLKRLAFSLELEPAPLQRVVNITRKQLELSRLDGVDPIAALLEMAQFYGIFVPVGDRWGFVHRTLQDFLAAQYWVESGRFAVDVTQGSLRFDSRTAFAGCLVDDATHVMQTALQKQDGIPVFAEMLMNDPSFSHQKIVKELISFYSVRKTDYYYSRTNEKLECHLHPEFIGDASSKFLECIVQTCGGSRTKPTDTLTAYAIVELVRRRVPLSTQAFAVCSKNFVSERFAIVIPNKPYLRFADVRHS